MESVDKWDSIGQMSLVAMIEVEFGIVFLTPLHPAFEHVNAALVTVDKFAIELTVNLVKI